MAAVYVVGYILHRSIMLSQGSRSIDIPVFLGQEVQDGRRELNNHACNVARVDRLEGAALWAALAFGGCSSFRRGGGCMRTCLR